MNLAAHFPRAHIRHWNDAELLYAHQRWGNADHLFGFSAECALKAIMGWRGMPVDRWGHPARREHRKHIRDLWEVFDQFGEHRSSEDLAELPPGSPFSDWSHHDRFSATGHSGRAAVDRHRRAARLILWMVRLVEDDTAP